MKTRIILLAGAAAVYVGYRQFQSYRTKAGTQSLIKQLKDAHFSLVFRRAYENCVGVTN
ncbi:MAG: hypothetical protein LCH91_02960 [Bacteroidetes bacterium]|nr:hypothetical protein [Bacteroidota bacterium]